MEDDGPFQIIKNFRELVEDLKRPRRKESEAQTPKKLKKISKGEKKGNQK